MESYGPRLIPTPQQIRLTDHVVSVGRRGAVAIAVEGPDPGAPMARAAAAWLAEAVGGPAPRVSPRATWRFRLGRVSPTAAALLESDLPAAVPDACRREVYRLVIAPGGAACAARGLAGLLAGAATLLQCLQVGEEVLAPEGEILDYPDVPYRVASNWLLNAEINRWSYDWGEGEAAFEERVRRALDRAARFKINGVLFDGFGWDTERTPGYADLMRRLSRFARERGIRLLFTGYDGGYGFTYQRSVLYRARYWGETFENRDPFPEGPLYSCFGDAAHPRSRELGTCCANDAQSAAKADEMARFVAAVQPGALYLHHTDLGSYAETAAGWALRCPRCRERWPSDALEAPDGAAGAFALLFRALAARLNRLPEEEGYRPARDCHLLFVGPLYTHYAEPDAREVWAHEVEFFVQVSGLLAGVPNAHFVIREQFRTAEGESRVARLAEAMHRRGAGHGVLVIWFGGGDRYLNDSLMAASSVLSPFNAGAFGVAFACGHAHQWPQQLLNAEVLWNLGSPLAESPRGYEGAIARFQELVRGPLTPAADDFLADACERLFGPAAAPDMSALYRLDPPPVVHVWWTITAEVARWEKEYPPADRLERMRYWLLRAETTRHAQVLLAEAERAGIAPDMRGETAWLERFLRVGRCFANLLAGLYGEVPDAAFRELLEDARGEIAEGPRDLVDPVGGDIGCWAEALAAIEARRNA